MSFFSLRVSVDVILSQRREQQLLWCQLIAPVFAEKTFGSADEKEVERGIHPVEGLPSSSLSPQKGAAACSFSPPHLPCRKDGISGRIFLLAFL